MTQPEKAERITITLPPEMLASLKAKINTGEYGSTSELIREAICIWQHKEKERQARLELIKLRMEKSLESGKPIPIEDVTTGIEELHRRTLNMDEYEAV